MNDTWIIFTDGGSRGNPGPAAYAYVIKRPGELDIEEKCYLGQTTNNIAEYTGMVKALEHARELGGRRLIVNSDSELMVKQMNGQYRVKNEGLRPLYLQAVKLCEGFEKVTFKHVYRENNTEADALCNEAMDNPRAAKPRVPLTSAVSAPATVPALAAPTPSSNPAPTPVAEPMPKSPKEVASDALTPERQAMALLREAAVEWAKGDATRPDPASVCLQLMLLLRRDSDPAKR